MGRKKNKPVERICKNCKLFNPKTSECAVVVLHEGKRLHLPVLAEDPCFFEDTTYFDPVERAEGDLAEDIKQVRFWVENDKGEKTNGNGVVKMEYPEGFFGDNADNMFRGLMDDPDIYEYLRMLRDLKEAKDLGL